MLSTEDRILITGASGFLGTALSRRLLANKNHNVNLFSTSDGNIVDYDFSAYKVNYICHLAAQTFVPKSWEHPYDYYKVNFLGTLNMLEYCRKHNAGMVFISTYMYGIPQYLPIDEKHPIEALSVYNHSKFLAEEACAFYSKHFNCSVTILRLFNVYGGGQNRTFLIPSLIQQALQSNTIEVMNTKPKRDFVYVEDVIDAIILSLGQKGFHIYNVGAGKSYSVLDVINIICRTIGKDKKIIDRAQTRNNEVYDIVADATKIKNELGWKPKIDIETGIEKTIAMFERI